MLIVSETDPVFQLGDGWAQNEGLAGGGSTWRVQPSESGSRSLSVIPALTSAHSGYAVYIEVNAGHLHGELLHGLNKIELQELTIVPRTWPMLLLIRTRFSCETQ